MSLSNDEVSRIALLARLQLPPETLPEYAGQLSGILELVEQMNAADISEVTPMAHPLDLSARLRPDDVSEHDGREQFLALAPATEAGLYLVPRVIE